MSESGTKPEILKVRITFPLCPRKQTQTTSAGARLAIKKSIHLRYPNYSGLCRTPVD
jgi:hypothetical protein